MTNNLLKFLNKNKYNILCFLIFTALLFLFVPAQEEYYWKSDIKEFKEKTYLKISIVSSIGLILIIAISNMIKKKSLKNILNSTFAVLIFCCWFFFFFQSIILSTILLINRKLESEKIVKNYKVLYVTENKLLGAYDINNRKKIIYEDEYLKYMNHKSLDEIKPNEILSVTFYKGFLGINAIKK